jgi:acetate---CoA ligase (ADP-forming)
MSETCRVGGIAVPARNCSVLWDEMGASLSRLLTPHSVAVVGASERRRMSNVALSHLLDADVELHLVHPTAKQAYGRPAVPSLSGIGAPVDAVLSLVSAPLAVDVVTEAGDLGCGGVVVVASGFAEAGPDGVALQDRLRDAATEHGVAVLGPNCTGFANVSRRVSLFTGTPVPLEAGGLSIVSQSGYLTRAAMVAARERNLGVHLAISCGNEAVTGLADLVDHLVDDPETDVICLVLEKVRHAARFFAAVERAAAAGKPVVAVKLGTSDRGRDIVRSHTGALATESWVYEVGLRQAGVVLAKDLDDLLDRSQFLLQVPRERWRAVHDIAVISSSGGVAALASDTLTDDTVRLPACPDLLPAIRAQIPGAPHANPLDLTGFALEPPEVVERLIEVFTGSGAVDAVVVCWWLGEEDEDRARLLLDPLRNVASRTDVPLVLTTVESSRLGRWTTAAGDKLVSFGRGLRGTVRGLAAMTDHVEGTARPRFPVPATGRPALARPASVPSAVGPMVGFNDAMTLLADHGVVVAPWTVADDASTLDPDAVAVLGDEVVVKLADVPHRTELQAVRLGVSPGDVRQAAEELTTIARVSSTPGRIAVQRRVAGDGEAFIGFRAHTDLGPVVMVGLGGVLVELANTVAGRLLPVTEDDVSAMLDQLGRQGIFRGLRGGRPWNRTAMARAVLGIADLGGRSLSWLESIDVNPLICDEDGCTAVDALIVLTEHTTEGN